MRETKGIKVSKNIKMYVSLMLNARSNFLKKYPCINLREI